MGGVTVPRGVEASVSFEVVCSVLLRPESIAPAAPALTHPPSAPCTARIRSG